MESMANRMTKGLIRFHKKVYLGVLGILAIIGTIRLSLYYTNIQISSSTDSMIYYLVFLIVGMEIMTGFNWGVVLLRKNGGIR